MIDKVVAVDFKGLEFSYDLKRLNLVIGPMGCGKTSISDTIELTTTGRITGAGKTNQAIMDAFATADKMAVGVNSNDQFFERRFIRNNKGTVTQKFRAGNAFVTKEAFISAFATAGRPTLFNLKAFMDLSDEKKINKVFELYPPEGDVFSLHEKIDETTTEINLLNAEITKTEGIIQKLTVDQAKIELPSGTLAEIQKDIERTTAEVLLARKNLKTQLKREVELEAQEKADGKAEEETKRPQLGGDPGYTARNSEDFKTEERTTFGDLPPGVPPKDYPTVAPEPAPPEYGTKGYAKEMVTRSENIDTIKLVQGIIDTMDKAGCTVCAAKLVAKQGLAKLLKYRIKG